MRGWLRWLGLVAALVLTTQIFGWWSVAVVAAAWGAWRGRQRDALAAGAAAAAAWGILLAQVAFRGPLGELAATVGAILGVSGPALIALTLIYAALLATSAAGASSVLGPRFLSPRLKQDRLHREERSTADRAPGTDSSD